MVEDFKGYAETFGLIPQALCSVRVVTTTADYRGKGKLEDTTDIPCFHCASLYCISQVCSFYKLKVCSNPASSKFISTTFPTAFADFLSLCHCVVILTVLQTFSL